VWRSVALSLVLAVALGVGGCSDSDDEGSPGDTSRNERRSFIALIQDGLLAEEDPSLRYSDSEAECVATAVVDALGVERLRSLGLDPSLPVNEPFEVLELTVQEQTRISQLSAECVDFETEVAAILAELYGFEPPLAACVAEKFVASGVSDDPLLLEFDPQRLRAEFDRVLRPAVVECGGDPSVLDR
jgi:hypothetical protein